MADIFPSRIRILHFCIYNENPLVSHEAFSVTGSTFLNADPIKFEIVGPLSPARWQMLVNAVCLVG